VTALGFSTKAIMAAYPIETIATIASTDRVVKTFALFVLDT
jgi:hypothetical protein